MACENLSKYYPIVMKFSEYLPYKSTRVLLIWTRLVEPFCGTCAQSGTTHYIAVVCVSETGILWGVSALSPSITR